MRSTTVPERSTVGELQRKCLPNTYTRPHGTVLRRPVESALFALMHDGDRKPQFHIVAPSLTSPATDVLPGADDLKGHARELATRSTKPSPLDIAKRLGMDYYVVAVDPSSYVDPSFSAWRVNGLVFHEMLDARRALYRSIGPDPSSKEWIKAQRRADLLD